MGGVPLTRPGDRARIFGSSIDARGLASDLFCTMITQRYQDGARADIRRTLVWLAAQSAISGNTPHSNAVTINTMQISTAHFSV